MKNIIETEEGQDSQRYKDKISEVENDRQS